ADEEDPIPVLPADEGEDYGVQTAPRTAVPPYERWPERPRRRRPVAAYPDRAPPAYRSGVGVLLAVGLMAVIGGGGYWWTQLRPQSQADTRKVTVAPQRDWRPQREDWNWPPAVIPPDRGDGPDAKGEPPPPQPPPPVEPDPKLLAGVAK